MERGFAGGVRIELVNANSPDATHDLRGTIEALDGAFSSWEASNLDGGDRIDPEGLPGRLSFHARLVNSPNPIGADPPVIVDVDGLALTLPAEAAARGFRISLEVDGQHAGAANWLLGDGNAMAPTGASLDAMPGDDRLAIHGLGMAPCLEGPVPYCHVYEIAPVTTTRVEIGDDLDARLRALGYLR